MKNMFGLGLILASFFVMWLSAFTVPEHEQALILQLGKVQGEPITKAGLHWKIPIIQEVRYFDKRILQWDGEKAEVPTLGKKFIWIDTTARWRIDDALAFYKAVRDIPTAMLRMGAVLDGVTRDTISSYKLIEVVRSSNDLLGDLEENKKQAASLVALNDSLDIEDISDDVVKIKHGRGKISSLIMERARKELKNFGIYLIDIQFRSIAYKEVVEQKVYNRMISERRKIATKIKSGGKGEEARILGQLDLTLKKIESDAYRQSQEIRGRAEAESIYIYAKSMKIAPDFYAFMKTLETYRNTLGKNGEFILSTDSAFLKLLNNGGQ